MKENAGFFTSRLKTDFLDTDSYFLPANQNVRLQHITNQNSCDVTAVFPYSNPNTVVDQ